MKAQLVTNIILTDKNQQPTIPKMNTTTTTHLKPIATNCDTYSGLQRCNELEKIIKHAYKEYQSEMTAMGNDIYSDNKENIIRLIERQQVYGESIADQYIDDMMDEHMRPDEESL